MEEEKVYCTIKEACEKAKVTRRTIYNWMLIGRLRFKYTPSGLRRILVNDLLVDKPKWIMEDTNSK